jgi:hypothetical protein
MGDKRLFSVSTFEDVWAKNGPRTEGCRVFSLLVSRGFTASAVAADLPGGVRVLAARLPVVSRRVLVVATATVPEAELRERVRAHAGEDAELLVVVPASKISKLAWLTNAEDDARAEAAGRAEEVAEAVPGDDAEARVGDSDPVKAIEDALRDFPAEELIVFTRSDEEAEWLEEGSGEEAQHRFSLPVTHLVVEQ